MICNVPYVFYVPYVPMNMNNVCYGSVNADDDDDVCNGNCVKLSLRLNEYGLLHPGHLLNLNTKTLSLKHLSHNNTGHPQLKLTVPVIIVHTGHILTSCPFVTISFSVIFVMFFLCFLITIFPHTLTPCIGHTTLLSSLKCSLHKPHPHCVNE